MRTGTTARDVMHREFLGVSESDALSDAVELMVSEGTDCPIVVRGGEPVGRLESREALSALLDGNVRETTVGEVMSPPLPTVDPSERLTTVRDQLVKEGVGRLVVIDDNEAVGVVTEHDALAAGTSRNPETRGEEVAVSAGGVQRSLGPEATADGEASRDVDRTMGVGGAETAGSTTQGVCEACGSLVPALTDSNGQAICPDCREV